MPAAVFKVKSKNGRWTVCPPSVLHDRCDIPLTNNKYQALAAARELAMDFAPAA